MGLSATHIVILAVVAVLLFGGGRFSSIMGDVAKGVKNFKKGMAEEDEPAPATRLEGKASPDPVVERAAEMARDAERPREKEL
jgi:sec-independent protein translocase protein TatA